MRSSWIVSGVLAAALLGSGAAFFLLPAHTSEKHARASAGENAEADVSNQHVVLPAAAPTSVRAPAETSLANPGVPKGAASERQQAPSPNELNARFSAVFDGEARDAGWAIESEREGRRFFDALEIGAHSRLRSIECRSTMCRLESVHDSEAALTTYVQRTFRDPANHIAKGPALILSLPSTAPNELTHVAYFAREGESLPDDLFVD